MHFPYFVSRTTFTVEVNSDITLLFTLILSYISDIEDFIDDVIITLLFNFIPTRGSELSGAPAGNANYKWCATYMYTASDLHLDASNLVH